MGSRLTVGRWVQTHERSYSLRALIRGWAEAKAADGRRAPSLAALLARLRREYQCPFTSPEALRRYAAAEFPQDDAERCPTCGRGL